MDNLQLDSQTQTNINSWLNGSVDEETKATIRQLLKENPQEVVNSFYTNLNFGTGGLRGIMGVGTNRMNVYTVRAATQGLANYLRSQPTPNNGHSVFISHDCRHNSRLFAEESAKVLAANEIKVYLTKELRPTPYVSFGCRHFQCSAAIMITASHNPPEYNGYKAYWNDGAQALPPHDKGIIAEVTKITDTTMVEKLDSLDPPLVELVGDELDKEYIRQCSQLQTYPKENHDHGKELSIIYSALHGTGITLVPKMLDVWGFTNYTLVQEQSKPNGDFPTVKSPNPEEKEALSLGIRLLEKNHADILTATDPDGDRVGVAVRHKDETVILNGNQIACLCVAHVCEALSSQRKMPEKAAFIKTIVTTELFKKIVESYDQTCFDTLTGFKYIAQLIREWEAEPDGYTYIFGGEESYGYLLGTLSRDKDAMTSTALICEAALHAKKEGKTLVDKLHDLYRQFGVFHDSLVSMKFPETKEGKDQMAKGMERLFNSSPEEFIGVKVESIENYETSIKQWLATGKTKPIALPKSKVLLFWLEDGSKLVMRPSGTEPKLKVYCGVSIKDEGNIEQSIHKARQHADRLTKAAKECFNVG